MSAVNVWKPAKLLSTRPLTESRLKCRFVSIAENRAPGVQAAAEQRKRFTLLHIFSAPYASLLHKHQDTR